MINKEMKDQSKTKLPCRRSIEERRNSARSSFPLLDANGSKVNTDRRTSPDRRYDVEIQWLRG